MKFKLEVTYVEFKRILTALLVCDGAAGTDLIEKLRAQDPANDGPEIAILTDGVQS